MNFSKSQWNSCTKQYAISKTTFIATRKSWSCVLCNRSEVHTYKLYIYLLKNLTIKDKCSEMGTMQSVFLKKWKSFYYALGIMIYKVLKNLRMGKASWRGIIRQAKQNWLDWIKFNMANLESCDSIICCAIFRNLNSFLLTYTRYMWFNTESKIQVN